MSQESRSTKELWAITTKVVAECRTPVLTTSSSESEPHATWMGAISGEQIEEVLSMTSPDSQKVGNIRATGRAEWMFTSTNKEQIVYLSGPTEIVDDVPEIKRCWQRIPEKQHAFFLSYYNSGVGFAIIRTRVEEIVLCEPTHCLKTAIARPV